MNRFGKMVLGLAVLIGCTNVQAALLHGIPGGDYNMSGTTATFAGAGYWTYSNSANASVAIVGEGEDRHLELKQEWYTRSASHWYVDDGTTPLDLPWSIGADMKWSKTTSGVAQKMFILDSTTNLSGQVFRMSFQNGSATWKAGSQTGTASVTLTNTYKRALIEYDPVTGRAVGKLDGVAIFDVVTETNLSVRSVGFANYANAWEPGTLSVDNVQIVPEPISMVLMGLGALFLRKRI